MKLQDKDFCPRIVCDIEYTVLFENNDNSLYCMGSKVQDRYIQLSDNNLEAVKKTVDLMNGTHRIKEIQDKMMKEYHIKINVLELCEWLAKAGLLKNPPEDVELEKQEMYYLSMTIKSFSLERCYGAFQWIGEKCWKKIVYMSICILLIGTIIGIYNWKDLVTLKSYEIHGSLLAGIIFMLSLFALSIGIHELAHAVVGYKCGLKPKEFVFALYVGTPMFYIKMPGIYTLTPKKRIAVWMAGIYSNIVIAAFCMILMSFANGILKTMLLIGCSTNFSLAVANLSPLLPLDGYFILSTMLKKPNLRKGSFQQFKNWVLRKNNSFSGLYVMYFLITIGFYIAFAVYEIECVVDIVKKGIVCGYTWVEYIFEFRIVAIVLAIIIMKKGLEVIMNIVNKKRLVSV